MPQGMLQPSGAGDVFAAPCNQPRIAPHRTATSRAFALDLLVQVEWLGIARPLFFYDSRDGGDDPPRLLQDYGVTDADVFPFNILLIVQRGAGDPRGKPVRARRQVSICPC